MDWEKQCAILQKRIDVLEAENQELCRRLGIAPKQIEQPKTNARHYGESQMSQEQMDILP